MIKKKKVDLLEGKVSDIFLKYLFPSVSATVMVAFNFFVDTLCIGQKFGEIGLAALNLSWPIITLLYSIGLMLGAGGGAMFSAYIAKNDKKRARSVYTSGIITMIVLAAIATILGLVFLDQIVEVLGGTGDTKQGVTDYVKYVMIFSVSYMGECFFSMFMRNDNAPKLAMMATLMSCTLNIILDVVFIYIFNWGMMGASLATSLAVTSALIFGVATTFRKKSNMKICFTYVRIKEVFCIMKVGFSTFLTEVDSGIVTFVYNTVLLRISGVSSITAIAIYGIVVNINTIVLAAMSGISNAMQPIVSANSGAGKLFRVKRFTHLAVKWALGMSVVFVVVIEWKAELLVRIFLSPDAEFLKQAAFAIRVVGASYVLAAANIIIVVYFQAIQASKQANSFSFMRTLIFPVTYVIVGAFYWGINGVWMASIFMEGTAIVVLVIAYRYYQRKRMDKNLSQLHFYDIEEEVESLDAIIEQLDADNLDGYREVMEYCLQRNTANEGIPMIIGLEDLRVTSDKAYIGSKEDEELSFTLAMGVLLFTDLFDQTEGAVEHGKPAIVPAMSALAEKFFRCELRGREKVKTISYRSTIPYRSKTKGAGNEQ